ncbi:hypothetical protein CONLIGDRAFT_648012 [Coniochaeta ligniaria NRRL 30616]|uniref:Uncharacterized protein n=1 Tax=Coniochaeta ligniaria NRRL 30616 TaxID=1408157 RepID=A0A1J7IBU9_9PEZI|nr:hypothetical protein CONLIGDRAFT_648012 [Coniochaeta ligniaria NRRL 30616]
MTTASNKNSKRRAARKKAKPGVQPSPASAPGIASSLTTYQPKATQSASQAFPDGAKSVNRENHRLNQGQSVKAVQSSPLDSVCRAQLELRIRIVEMNLDLEQSHREHWKRELDKSEVEQKRLDQMSVHGQNTSWEFFEQTKNVDAYNQALVEDMFMAAHREVVKLERELSALEFKLKKTVVPAVQREIK